MGHTPFPTIVCLCGSTRFFETFQEAGLTETLAGKIVLSLGSNTGTNADHFGHLSPEEQERIVTGLLELHLRKIELADEFLILNVGDYVGQHTQTELEHARALNKKIRWWLPTRQAIDGEGNRYD